MISLSWVGHFPLIVMGRGHGHNLRRTGLTNRAREERRSVNHHPILEGGARFGGYGSPPTSTKLVQLRSLLGRWRRYKGCSKRDLLSLVGVLSHACKFVKAGRSFLRRLIDLSTVVSGMDSHIRLTQAARSDLEWWYLFSEDWNGVAMLSLLRKDIVCLHPMHLATGDVERSPMIAGFNCSGRARPYLSISR
jgi:hypothetical protein